MSYDRQMAGYKENKCALSQYLGIALRILKKLKTFFIYRNSFLFNILSKSQRKPNQVKHE